jgi:hypothetical protein
MSIVVRPLASLLAALALLTTAAVAAETITPRGSSFGLVPPAGFALSNRFTGFEDGGTGSTVLLAELDKAAYAQLEQATTADLSAQGIEFSERVPLKAGAIDGLLFVGAQHVGGLAVRKWIFIFPAESFTGMVTASVPEQYASIHPDADVRAALASIAVGAPVPLAEAVGALPFTLAETETLKFVKTMGGGAVGLTTGSKTTDPDRRQPWLIISSSPGYACPGTPRETGELLLRNGAGLEDVKVAGVQEVKVSDGPGVEVEADAIDSRSRVPLHVVERVGPFDGRDCLMLVGRVRPEQADAAVPEFRKVMDTVQLKTP